MYYTIELDKILKDEQLSTIVHNAALHLKNHQYINLGDFFKGLQDDEVQELVDASEVVHKQVRDDPNCTLEYATKTIMLLTSILVTGEGSTILTTETLIDAANTTMLMINLEQLNRQKQIELNHHNMSFDNGDQMLARRK